MRVIKWMLAIALFFGASRFCHDKTDGFALTKISQVLLEGEEDLDLELPRFRYLGKGGQCYVFVSEDDSLVLKVFRGSRRNALALLPFVNTRKLDAKLRKELESYVLASEMMRDGTGILVLHVRRSKGLAPLRIVDKLGIEHTMDANATPFVVQRKATEVREAIGAMMREDPAKAKNAIRELFALIHERVDLGLFDHDPNVNKNFGYVGNEPIQFDPGRFSKTPTPDRLENAVVDFRNWCSVAYPELVEVVDEAYEGLRDAG